MSEEIPRVPEGSEEPTKAHLYLYDLRARVATALPNEILEVRAREVQYLLEMFDRQIANIAYTKYRGGALGYDTAIHATAAQLRDTGHPEAADKYERTMLEANLFRTQADAMGAALGVED